MGNAVDLSDFDLTKNQSVVFDVLERAGRPMGAYDILGEVRDAGLKGPPQVYRALERLQSLGLVHRIDSLNAFLVCPHGPHEEPAAFVICDDCQRTIELPFLSAESILRGGALPQDFSVKEVKVEVRGVCRNCQSKKDD